MKISMKSWVYREMHQKKKLKKLIENCLLNIIQIKIQIIKNKLKKFSKNYHLPTEFYLIKKRNRITINSVEIMLSMEVIKEEVVEAILIILMEVVISVEISIISI